MGPEDGEVASVGMLGEPIGDTVGDRFGDALGAFADTLGDALGAALGAVLGDTVVGAALGAQVVVLPSQELYVAARVPPPLRLVSVSSSGSNPCCG